VDTPVYVKKTRQIKTRAFSSKVDTGLREENASSQNESVFKQSGHRFASRKRVKSKTRARLRFNQKRMRFNVTLLCFPACPGLQRLYLGRFHNDRYIHFTGKYFNMGLHDVP
jgi:hypothetical protein